MKSENSIHIRFNYNGAVESKRDILKAEISLINLVRDIATYKEMRSLELQRKLDLMKKMKELRATMRSLTGTLPKLKIPKILEEEKKKETPKEKEEEHPKVKEIKKAIHKDDLEPQLQEIKEKLRSLH